MGALERDYCSICKQIGNISRTYYYFPIACECCGSHHHELVRHCADCKPVMPRVISLEITAVKLLDPIKEGLFKKVNR
jgi:hypothetical protein